MARLAPLALRRADALAPAIFVLLAMATIGAFFVTTRLKRSTPVVERLTFARYVSPNGDGRHESVVIGFRIKREDEVTVAVVDDQGEEVRTLARDLVLDRGRHRLRWDGRREDGRVAPDGEYRVRVGLRRQARSITSPRKLFVDTRPPTPLVRYVSPDAISPDGAGGANRASLRFDGPVRRRPTLLVYRTDGLRPRLVARRAGTTGSARLSWDGRVGPAREDRPAATGNYLLVVRTSDAAGNVGPTRIPPRRNEVRGHPGVRVRYVAARGPLHAVPSGARVRFAVTADGRRYRWRVRRLGSNRSLRRGRGRERRLDFAAPRGRSGVYLLGVRVGRHRYETPFAVDSRRRGRVLVVLPAITWQGRNEVDTDGDGFGDLLPADRTVGRARAFAGNGLPPGFTAREAPLLLGLDAERRHYELATDLELGAAGARATAGRGLLFAGAPRLFSPELAALARSHARRGGRVAWLGTGGFTQPVRVERQALTSLPQPARLGNALGERLRRPARDAALTVLGDRIRLFGGVGGPFGPFPALEPSRRLPRGARPLAAAGHESGRASLVVYRDGEGIVARVGVDGFARAARESPAVARIMRRLWSLLSR